MIKVKAIENFTLKRFEELKNIERSNPDLKEEGSIYVGDIFECDENMVKYLCGDNREKKKVINIISVEPETKKEVPKIDEEKIVKKVLEENKPTKKKKNKK